MSNSYQRFIGAAANHGLNVRETTQGRQANIQTPGHSARDLGTSVTYNNDRVLVHCHNGEVDDVLTELGIEKRDLFDDPKGSEYKYDDGRVVYRTPDKKFRQDGNKQGTSLFGLDSLHRAGPVYVLEGENDVMTATSVCEVAAVTQSGGSNNNPNKADWTVLQGRDVVIVRDNDQPGHKRAGKVLEYLESLTQGPATIQVVDVTAGKDLSDHVAAGKGLEELVPVSCSESTEPGRRISLIPASGVRTERLDWLIDSWVPRRSLTLLAGREGLGKSTIACGIAAQATRGELNGPPMNVAYLNTEDSRSITVKPRLEAAGADLDRVFFIDVTTDEGNAGALQLPGDTSLLARELAANDVGLVILDAAKSAMHSSLDGYRDDDVRQFLEPLSAMCDQYDMAVIGLVHFGKRESNDPGKLILGSVAWSQIARSVLSVAVDDEGTLIVTNTKANLAPSQISREARLESVTVATDDGKGAEVGRVVWGDNTNVSAAELLSTNEEQDDDRNEIEAIVLDYLESQGGSAPAGDVLKATRAAGLNDGAVKKLRKKIGVKTERQGFGPGAKWVWTIDSGIDSIDTRTRARESMESMGADSGATVLEFTPRANTGGPTGPTGPDQRKQNDPTGSNSQLGHTQDNGPTGGPTAQIGTTNLESAPGPSSKIITFSQPKNVGDSEVEDAVISSLSTEYGMTSSVVSQSVPRDLRDQVPDILDRLTNDGRVILDAKNRYLLNSARKGTTS